MKIVVFGLTLTSSWGNGHATTYRSLLKALSRRGHRIHFVEKDVEWYASNRDLPEPAYCEVHFYESWDDSGAKLVTFAKDADIIVIGSFFPDARALTDALFAHAHPPIIFYDIDTPITLAQLRSSGRTEYLDKSFIPLFAAYLSFTGGPALQELEAIYGAKRAVAFYCSVDPDLYHPTETDARFACDFSYLGTYAADRQPKLLRFLNEPARMLPERQFLVAGPQYPVETSFQANVRRMIHIHPPDHPAFYSSSRFSLNLTRQDMVSAGYSPSVRLFEASACGATIISDDWPGLDQFLTPGKEVLLAKSPQGVTAMLTDMDDSTRARIGQSARDRILAEHTSAHRAAQFEEIVSDLGAEES